MQSPTQVSPAHAVVRTKGFVRGRCADATGAVAAEYAFLLALIAVVIVAGALAVGNAILNQVSAGAGAIGP